MNKLPIPIAYERNNFETIEKLNSVLEIPFMS